MYEKNLFGGFGGRTHPLPPSLGSATDRGCSLPLKNTKFDPIQINYVEEKNAQFIKNIN